MSLSKFVRSKRYKNFMAKLYGWGASVVILGALFKILHMHGADLMLMLGMGTEAIIFFCSAFEPLHKEYNWSLVYPELGLEESDKNNQPKGSPTQRLDKMLLEAKIGPELIDSLAAGMKNLGENAKRLSYTTDAATVTEGYVANLSKAKEAVRNLTGVYEKSADAIVSTSDMQLKSTQEIIQAQKQHAQKLQDTLSTSTDLQMKSAQELFEVQRQHAQKLQTTLNTTSEIQEKRIHELFDMQKEHARKLQEAQALSVQKVSQIQEHGSQVIAEHYKKVEDSAAKLAFTMNESVQEVQKYKQEVDKMSQRVSQINAIYANMLAAMTNR